METIELLRRFADPEVMKTLSLMERMTAGLITTVLGMGITFVALVVLQLVMALMARLSAEPEKAAELETQSAVAGKNGENFMDDEEIVAAITTALALQLRTSVSNIVIRNIERVEDPSPIWQRAGIAEHMNNSL